MMRKFLGRRGSGFSLLEVMVVLGLLGGAGLIAGKLLLWNQKGQKKVSANFDFTTKMWEVFNVLQNTDYCNPSTNLVFKEKGATGVLIPARLSSESTPAINTVNWIGYQLGAGASAQDIKVLAEGDVIENTLTVSEITFERQKTDATPPQVVLPLANTPTTGRTTHYLNLVITANPTSGSGFPVTKSFKLMLVTNSSRQVVGCASQVASGALPSARTVSCNLDSGSGTSKSCQADCAPDEIVVGGGFSWGCVISSWGRNNYPNGNGWYCNINIQNCTCGTPATGCDSRCFARCLKKS